MTPSFKPDCIENLPFDVNSALPVRIDHPSLRTSDTALPSEELFEPPPASEKEHTTHVIQVGDSDEENSFVTTTSATKELAPPVLMDSDCLETNEDGDLSTVVLENRGKGIDPREHGGALYDPKSMIVPAGTTSTGESDFIELVGVHWDKGNNIDPEEKGNEMAKCEPGPSRIDFHDSDEQLEMFLQAILLESFKPTIPTDFIELVGVHRDKGKNVDPEERGNGMAKYEPNPSRIDFHDHEAVSLQKQGIPFEPFEPTKTTDLNDGLPYDPTLPRPRWYPKISLYRFIVFSIPLAIGTAKAILSYKGSATTPITLEWISGVVILLV